MHNKDNQQIDKKYQKSSSFNEQMTRISKQFSEFEQQAYYSQLEETATKMIIPILPHSPLSLKLNNAQHISYYLIIGTNQPLSLEKVLLNIIHLMPRPKAAYTIVYVNTLAPKDSYNDFIKATEFLPIEYCRHLEGIYVLHALFMNRAMGWFSFNTVTSFIKSKTHYCSQFYELGEKLKLSEVEFLNLLPLQIRKELCRQEEYVDTIVNKYAIKLVSFSNLLGPGKSEEAQQSQGDVRRSRMPIFKSSMASTIEKKAAKRFIQDYPIGHTGAPLPLELLIFYFNERDQLLLDEGIFRKSVSIDEQNQILAELDERNYNFIESVKNPHVIANAIKRFTANLLAPVVPYPLFHKFMNTSEPNLTPLIIEGIQSLPALQRKTLLILFQFFLERVIPKEANTKMSLKNICIVLSPCIMRAEVISIKDLVYSQKIILVTSIIFREFTVIFGNKKQREEAIRQTSKDYNKIYLEDRLGRSEVNIGDESLKPASLTNSQSEVLEESRRSEDEGEDPMQSYQKRLERKETLCKKISDVMKYDLEDQGDNDEEDKYEKEVKQEKEKEKSERKKSTSSKKKEEQPDYSCEYSENVVLEQECPVLMPLKSLETRTIGKAKVSATDGGYETL